jgi:hypothetical protein
MRSIFRCSQLRGGPCGLGCLPPYPFPSAKNQVFRQRELRLLVDRRKATSAWRVASGYEKREQPTAAVGQRPLPGVKRTKLR